jgi:exopolysaccharide biosynthesis polyprenyl glycosylphosphotransferase
MWDIRRRLFWLFDILLLLLAFVATGWLAPLLERLFLRGGLLYGHWVQALSPPPSHGTFPSLGQYLLVFLIVAPVTVMCVDILGGHALLHQQRKLRILVVSVLAPLGGVAFLSTLLYVLKTPIYSRLFVFSFAGVSCAFLAGSRVAGRAWYRYTLRQGLHVDEIAIVGEPETVRLVASRLGADPTPQAFTLVGYFSLNGGSGPVSLDGGLKIPRLGDVKDVGDVLVHKAIQRVVMVLPPGGSGWLQEAIGACDYLRVTVHIVPETLLLSRPGDLSPAPNLLAPSLPALTLAPSESGDEWLAVKRVLDVCVSASLLVLLAPVFLAIALAIKLTTPKLPLFYPWRVVGYRGRRFTGYKFTTMVADADAEREKLASLNEMTGPVFKITNDPRVTRLGRFLRKYSLNELPQFWSVLKGDMSLVGPRPAGPHELERYELWHKRKLSAKPGITCFWQVRGRNRISNFDDWVRLDLEYIRTRSFWVDCKILAKTAWVVVRGTGC